MAAVLLLCRYGVPLAFPGFEGFRVAFLGAFVAELGILLWWLFFSRTPHLDRWLAVATMFAALVLTWRLNHESMGLMWGIGYGLPVLCLALVAWAVASRDLGTGSRRLALVATMLLVSLPWALIRTEGMTGDHTSVFAWRWAATSEERLLAEATGTAVAHRSEDSTTEAFGAEASSTPERTQQPRSVAASRTWPGFRGAGRDSKVSGLLIRTDWSVAPPQLLWRRSVGPGWSSFALDGDFLYTQEQRGEEEMVSCYRASTGEPVWRHRDPVRFYEAIGGAGPRSTPTLHQGQLYTLGATGLLNALDARTGQLRWSRDVAQDLEADLPIWGFAGSPLMVDDTLVVAVAGTLRAFDPSSGQTRWTGPEGEGSYSSPQLVELDGERQILQLSGIGTTALHPADGTVLWTSSWAGQPLVQPALTGDGDLLVSAGEGYGLRRLSLRRATNGWTSEERWTSNRLKPNFNDFVVHRSQAYGFDGSILACIDLENGQRCWKGGRYGQGQLLLLSDQDLLLVISEQGELILVRAEPDEHTELARYPAIEGKTWNHPILVGDRLFVRNGQEMAAFKLPPADPPGSANR